MDVFASPSNISLRQLRAFCLVAQEGSMTRAAVHMHLTISALSMLVRTMEEELGMRLFERTTRRMELTDAGLLFLPTAREVLAKLDAGVATLQASQRLHSARLSVVTSPLIASSLLPHVIARFREQFPHITVTLTDALVDQVVSSVREGRSDLGICTADQGSADLLSQVLYEDALVLACSKDHPLAQYKELHWADITDQNLILLTAGSGLRALVDQTLAGITLQCRPAFEVANIQTAVGLVAAGLGVAILPAYSLTRTQDRDVVAVPLIEPVVTREIVAICLRTKPFSSTAEAFLSHFKKYTASHA
jgi:LysR family transcriptional regulator, carnitine catabolism transcriptional activator